MNPAPLPAPVPRPLPGVRVGDAERERLADVLAEHFAAGRLTLAEFTDRADAAAHARTSHDLLVLTADLPRLDAPGAVAPVVAPVARPVGPGPVLVADVFFAIFGPLAALCLLMLLGLTGRGNEFFVGFFAALGGAVSAGALVHLVHRQAARRRAAQPGMPWAE